MIVILGNPQPVHATERDENDQPNRVPVPSDAYEGDESQTVVGPFPEGTGLVEALTAVADPGRGVWDAHSDGPPSWVASDVPLLAEALAEHYGCSVKKLPRDQARAFKAAAALVANEPAAEPDDKES